MVRRFDGATESLWLLGSLLVGILVVSGNAASWSLADHGDPWYGLAVRGLLGGTVLYVASLGVRLALRAGRHHS